jgi:hypothetical protein
VNAGLILANPPKPVWDENGYRIIRPCSASPHRRSIPAPPCAGRLDLCAVSRVTALLGDHVTALVATYSGVMEQVTSGKFRVLAATGRERIAALPAVPTVAE